MATFLWVVAGLIIWIGLGFAVARFICPTSEE